MKTSIPAVYENGVFRPMAPVNLPEHCEVDVTVRALHGDAGKNPLQRLAEIADGFPDNSDLPTDFAAQHDHYLYGTPKHS